MTLFRASLATGTATLVRILAGLVLNKVFAIYVGPSGLAQVGQVGTLVGLMSGVGSGGVSNGVSRYVAEYRDDDQAARVVATALAVALVAVTTMAALSALFAERIAARLLDSPDRAWVIHVVAAASAASALSGLLSAVLAGMKRIVPITLIGIAGIVIALICGVALTVHFGLAGALAATCLAAGIPGIVALIYFCSRADLRTWIRVRPDRDSLRRLGRYSVMALTAAIAGPTSVILVRDHAATTLSWQDAGYWQGVWKLSEVYLSFAASLLSAFVLPYLAAMRSADVLRNGLLHVLRTLIPMVAAAALAIWLARYWIVRLVFTDAFLPMAELFWLQLIGDVVKIAAWVFAYFLVAKGLTFAYVATELVFSASFYLLSVLMIGRLGLLGITAAYALNYLVYLVTLAIIVATHLRALARVPAVSSPPLV